MKKFLFELWHQTSTNIVQTELTLTAANKSNPDFTQAILDIEDLVSLGQKHR